MRCKSRAFLPAVGKQRATFSPYFTQPGVHLLEIPCTPFSLHISPPFSFIGGLTNVGGCFGGRAPFARDSCNLPYRVGHVPSRARSTQPLLPISEPQVRRESYWRGNLHAECDAIWLVRQLPETLTLRTSAFPELEVTLTVRDSRRGLGSVQ